MAPIDQVQLSFNPQTLTVLNAVLGLVMFGVALELKVSDFRDALKTPKALALGLFGHHILFPAMTYVLVWLLQPQPSIALGMILVSSCPAWCTKRPTSATCAWTTSLRATASTPWSTWRPS